MWTIHARTLEPVHGDATSTVRFVACRTPEHRVTLHVTDKNRGITLAGVELRLGRFRAATDATGIACVELPGGTYEVGTWKDGFDVLSKTVTVTSDMTIHLELAAAPEPQRPYWM